MSELAQSVLVVDDDERFRTQLSRAFVRRGWEVWSAEGPPEALALAREHYPEHAVIDLRMPGGSGLDLLRGLLEVDPETNVVVLTAYGSIATALEAVRRGATHYLTKPANLDDVIAAFARRGLGPDEDAPAIAAETPSLARVEWEHIQRVLTDCNGNITHAA
ncbi:MAG: response regulator, partial [Myxococcota bacterium]